MSCDKKRKLFLIYVIQVKLPAMPLVPLGRHGTDSVRWLEMPLSNIESTPRVASR